MKSISILGNKVTTITVDELHEEIKKIIVNDRKELVLHTNVHGINLAEKYKWLKDFRNEAYIVHCDGAGVILGAMILGFDIPCRITYADWMWQLSEYCELNGVSMYFLGGKVDVAEKAATKLRQQYPKLKIVGVHHGYFVKEGPESKHVVSAINSVKPDVLLVGFGMPEQENWIRKNWKGIDAHVFMACGACFDMIANIMPRCPKWWAEHNLEWFFRLLVEPRRLFTRYVVGNPKFMFRVVLERLRSNKCGQSSAEYLATKRKIEDE
jgi:N-acetylglucosaminyldiphosphoundecaprenol N-acetyl-beta-D-mannosaminyltransferase